LYRSPAFIRAGNGDRLAGKGDRRPAHGKRGELRRRFFKRAVSLYPTPLRGVGQGWGYHTITLSFAALPPLPDGIALFGEGAKTFPVVLGAVENIHGGELAAGDAVHRVLKAAALGIAGGFLDGGEDKRRAAFQQT